MLAFAEVLADAKGFEDVGKLELGRAGQVASEFWADFGRVEASELRWLHTRSPALGF